MTSMIHARRNCSLVCNNGVATIVKTQERAQESANERRNKQLFISIGKEDE